VSEERRRVCGLGSSKFFFPKTCFGGMSYVLGFLGGEMMVEALIGGIDKSLTTTDKIIVSDPAASLTQYLQGKFKNSAKKYKKSQ
jgi:hypothetical protein